MRKQFSEKGPTYISDRTDPPTERYSMCMKNGILSRSELVTHYSYLLAAVCSCLVLVGNPADAHWIRCIGSIDMSTFRPPQRNWCGSAKKKRHIKVGRTSLKPAASVISTELISLDLECFTDESRQQYQCTSKNPPVVFVSVRVCIRARGQ